ncbi:MAG: HDOD domain-containing protein [Proteobacteria bacterium]|nr:HDOD domain-containing protein [Pseudomonadota bacterium]
MLKQKIENQKAPLYAFGGLDEKELNTLYNLATNKTLQQDEVLFAEGDTDQTLYVVLEGEIRVVKHLHGQQTETVSTLRDGAWVGEIGFTGKIPRMASALANKPSRVLAIDKATVNALDEKTQLFLFKRLNFLASMIIGDLNQREKGLAAKNRQLTENLFSARTKEKPDYSSSEMIQSIVNKVPKLPVFASTLTHKLLGGGISLKEVSEMIQADPSLVGLVLKTLNSSYYGFYKKISDIHRGVVLLGLNGLHQLVMDSGVRRIMPDTPYFNDLHYHSVAISHIAFALSQNVQFSNPAQMATIGLLHDLGQVVTKLLKDRNPNLNMLIDSLDRAQIGAVLLKKWNLPEVVWRSTEFQFYPEFSLPTNVPADIRINVAILYLAHLCSEFLQGHSEHDLPTVFVDDYLPLLKWERLSVADIAQRYMLPGLIKKKSSLPAFLRELLEEHLGAGLPEAQGQG